jgi:hypothetical protein
MLLRRTLAGASTILLLGAVPASAQAGTSVLDILGAPFRWVGGQLVGGGVDKLKGTLDATIQNVSKTAEYHEDRIEGAASRLLTNAQGKVDDSLKRAVDNVNHGLEERILQIKTSADDSIDRAIGKVDGSLAARLEQLDAIGSHLVADLGTEVRTSLDKADAILRDRSQDLDRMANDLVAHADQVLESRLAQIDEIAGRRLGNVDVIATKQRIALEEGALRVSVLIGLVSFVVFVVRKLWSEFQKLPQAEWKKVRGGARTMFVARRLAPALREPIAAAVVGAAVLFGLYQWLPMGARREAEELTRLHQRQLEASVTRLDYARARFHASHLEFLKPEDAARAGATADKVALMRDLIARPTMLATAEGLSTFDGRVRAVERAIGPRPDPDLLVLRALAKWEVGQTRVEEYEAASLAVRALRLSPRGFALAPLARAYVETFLTAPYIPEETGVSRDAASMDDFRDALVEAAPDRADSPFAPMAELAALMRKLERVSTHNYVRMVEAQAKMVEATCRGLPAETLTRLRADRLKYAERVVQAWTTFDKELRESSDLGGPLVLNIFRLNDALLTRALWIRERPNDPAPAPRLEDIDNKTATIALRLKLAPARIAWARRYQSLLNGPAKQIVEFEETERFRTWERWSIEFEQAMVAQQQAAEGPDEASARWRVVTAASFLGMYVEQSVQPGKDAETRPATFESRETDRAKAGQTVSDVRDDRVERVPYALLKAGALKGAPPSRTVAAKRKGPAATPAACRVEPGPVIVAPVDLEEALRARGPRLI